MRSKDRQDLLFFNLVLSLSQRWISSSVFSSQDFRISIRDILASPLFPLRGHIVQKCYFAITWSLACSLFIYPSSVMWFPIWFYFSSRRWFARRFCICFEVVLFSLTLCCPFLYSAWIFMWQFSALIFCILRGGSQFLMSARQSHDANVCETGLYLLYSTKRTSILLSSTW